MTPELFVYLVVFYICAMVAIAEEIGGVEQDRPVGSQAPVEVED